MPITQLRKALSETVAFCFSSLHVYGVDIFAGILSFRWSTGFLVNQ